ncbi:MAG: DUF2914 domain-containing protein [Gammaproteobacteria bacterium]
MTRKSHAAIMVAILSQPLMAEPEATAVPADVARAQFTSAIQRREPADNLVELNGPAEKIFFYTEVSGMTDQLLIHSWEFKGESVAEVRFRAGGPRWRVWSSKQMSPDMQGTWTVVVLNAAGDILAEKTLDYNPDDLTF